MKWTYTPGSGKSVLKRLKIDFALSREKGITPSFYYKSGLKRLKMRFSHIQDASSKLIIKYWHKKNPLKRGLKNLCFYFYFKSILPSLTIFQIIA
jgi:hypothetical protein